MTDAKLLSEFAVREQRWVERLHALGNFHHVQLGKAIGPVHWMAGRELGRYSWLGYYWPQEVFWFGYGLYKGAWIPLIEADNRSTYSELWRTMREQLAGTWEAVAAERDLYSRLWAPADIAGEAEAELEWFKSRSCELHEFVVHPDA